MMRRLLSVCLCLSRSTSRVGLGWHSTSSVIAPLVNSKMVTEMYGPRFRVGAIGGNVSTSQARIVCAGLGATRALLDRTRGLPVMFNLALLLTGPQVAALLAALAGRILLKGAAAERALTSLRLRSCITIRIAPWFSRSPSSQLHAWDQTRPGRIPSRSADRWRRSLLIRQLLSPVVIPRHTVRSAILARAISPVRFNSRRFRPPSHRTRRRHDCHSGRDRVASAGPNPQRSLRGFRNRSAQAVWRRVSVQPTAHCLAYDRQSSDLARSAARLRHRCGTIPG